MDVTQGSCQPGNSDASSYLPRLAKLRNLSHGCAVQFPITEITDALLASYSRHGGINHLDGINLPSKASVADITRDLLRLVFPSTEGSPISAPCREIKRHRPKSSLGCC